MQLAPPWRETLSIVSLGNNDRSLILYSARGLASQAVCVGHALSYFGLYPEGFGLAQNYGVVVFFLLSGFLIAHVIRHTESFSEYFLDRLSRIYTAYIPALLLIGAIGWLAASHGAYGKVDDLSFRSLIGNLLMLQMWTGPRDVSELFKIPFYASAGQLWTVAVEWHIYIFVGAIWFVPKSKFVLLLALTAFVFSFVPLQYLASDVQGGLGTALFSLWLMGFGGYFVINRLSGMSLWTIHVLIALSLLAYLAQSWGNAYEPKSYPWLAFAFLLIMAAAGKTNMSAKAGPVVRFAKWAADYSFSLYLLHYSLMHVFKFVWTGSPYYGAIIVVVGSNLLAILMAYLTERHYRQVRTWVRAGSAGIANLISR